MKLTCPNDKTPELPMKMYDPTTTRSLISASVATRCMPAGSIPTAATIAVNIKPSARSGSSHWVAE